MDCCIYEEVIGTLHPGSIVFQCDDRPVPVHLLGRTNLRYYYSPFYGPNRPIFPAPYGFVRSWIRCALAIECYLLRGTRLSHLFRDEELDKLLMAADYFKDDLATEVMATYIRHGDAPFVQRPQSSDVKMSVDPQRVAPTKKCLKRWKECWQVVQRLPPNLQHCVAHASQEPFKHFQQHVEIARSSSCSSSSTRRTTFSAFSMEDVSTGDITAQQEPELKLDGVAQNIPAADVQTPPSRDGRQVFIDAFSDDYVDYLKDVRACEWRTGQKRPSCTPQKAYVFKPPTRPASYFIPPSETLNFFSICHDLAFCEEEVESLLQMRADYIVQISGSGFNDVCYDWLATAVKRCSSAGMIELLQKMTQQSGLHSRHDVPGNLAREMRLCYPIQGCSPGVTDSRCHAWKAVFEQGFGGGWTSAEKLCVIQLLIQFDLPIISGHLAHCANKEALPAPRNDRDPTSRPSWDWKVAVGERLLQAMDARGRSQGGCWVAHGTELCWASGGSN